MDTVTLTFMIASRNRREPLSRCLASIGEQTYGSIETIVVDDASDDGTAQMIEQEFPWVRVLVNEERKGVGGALAAGAEVASGDVLINLDDDCYLTGPETASVIARYMSDPSSPYDVLCFKVIAPDGSIRHREIPLRSKKLPTADTPIGYFLGGAVAFRAAALKKAGGYPATILYGSWENDTAFRLFKSGARTLFVPGVTVVHTAVPSPYNTQQRQANYVRNEMRIAARFLPAPYAHVHSLLWIADCLRRAATTGQFRATLQAVVSAAKEWGSIRSDASQRLSLAQTRELSALSGRTWY